jgi:hypothetical protein
VSTLIEPAIIILGLSVSGQNTITFEFAFAFVAKNNN